MVYRGDNISRPHIEFLMIYMIDVSKAALYARMRDAEARRSDRRGVDNHLLGNTEGHRRHIDDGLPDSPIGHTTHAL